ncbi:MAG: HNH endonuclease [Candidatus Desantisbacteria bacterium]
MDNKLPPLTILVINQSGLPGSGFIAWDVDDFDTGKNKVFNYNWENANNPFEYARNGKTQDEIVDSILKKNLPIEYEQIVKVRGIAQEIFRKLLLKIYQSKCCICNISIEDVLEAAHIKSWSDCELQEKISSNNGLLLCSLHHRLFDKRIMKITQEYKIAINLKQVKDKEPERTFILQYNNKQIQLPANIEHYPKKEYLT